MGSAVRLRRTRDRVERGGGRCGVQSGDHLWRGVVVRAPSVVARRDLFELLLAAGSGGVTLVSAPAGSGKTVLLRSWIEDAGLGDCAGWVSVERGERDAQRFWLSVVEELRAAVGAEAFVERLAPTPDSMGRRSSGAWCPSSPRWRSRSCW